MKLVLMIIVLLCAAFANSVLAQEGAQAPVDEEDKHVQDQPVKPLNEDPRSILREVAQEGSSQLTDIPDEERMFQINDIVKIRISEKSSTSDQSIMKTQRNMNIDASIEDYVQLTSDTKGILPKFITPNTIKPTLALESETERDNKGRASRVSSMESFVTGMVMDVKPNGTLVISAQKTLIVGEEEQKIRLTGIIRKEDVSAENVIDSSDIADLQIEYIGEGPITDSTKRGLIGKIFDAIWPF